jgi:hypothetical protein
LYIFLWPPNKRLLDGLSISTPNEERTAVAARIAGNLNRVIWTAKPSGLSFRQHFVIVNASCIVPLS